MNDPILFNDSLASRAYVHKSLRIGNPYAFLNSIGISPILEQVYRGSNIVDIAEQLNVSITILLNWMEQEGHSAKFEDATKLGAEGYISEAGKLLRAAKTDFELKKAERIAHHGRFMAGKLDKGKYGEASKNQTPHQGVTFILHMGADAQPKQIALTQTATLPPPEANFINGDYTNVTLIPSEEDEALFNQPEEVAVPDGIGPFEPTPFLPDETIIPPYLKQA